MNGICPHDGLPAYQSPRYPDALCSGCSNRATDLGGRPVAMGNVSLSGGFTAWHRDDKTPCDQVTGEHVVLIDGTRFRADEAHMGGTVVRPVPA